MASGGYTVETFYEEWFSLYYHCKMPFSEFENLMPFERDIFVGMFNRQREEEDNETTPDGEDNMFSNGVNN